MTMEERLEKVERKLSRVMRARTRARVQLRVRKLALVDKRGRERGTLGVTEDGWPALSLLDENGNSRVLLDVPKGGPRLRLLDEKGKVRAVLAVDEDGPGLSFLDEG